MKKRNAALFLIGTLVAGTTYLSDKKNREKAKKVLNDSKQKIDKTIQNNEKLKTAYDKSKTKVEDVSKQAKDLLEPKIKELSKKIPIKNNYVELSKEGFEEECCSDCNFTDEELLNECVGTADEETVNNDLQSKEEASESTNKDESNDDFNEKPWEIGEIREINGEKFERILACSCGCGYTEIINLSKNNTKTQNEIKDEDIWNALKEDNPEESNENDDWDTVDYDEDDILELYELYESEEDEESLEDDVKTNESVKTPEEIIEETPEEIIEEVKSEIDTVKQVEQTKDFVEEVVEELVEEVVEEVIEEDKSKNSVDTPKIKVEPLNDDLISFKKNKNPEKLIRLRELLNEESFEIYKWNDIQVEFINKLIDYSLTHGEIRTAILLQMNVNGVPAIFAFEKPKFDELKKILDM